ncbi:MAG: hypothetical protein OCD01_06275 [Fibrobacterales bacterium]
MNHQLIKTIPLCIGFLIIMGCFGEATSIASSPSTSSSETSKNTEEPSTTAVSSEEITEQSSTIAPASSDDDNESSEVDEPSSEYKPSKNESSSDTEPTSSSSSKKITNALMDDDGNCISYKEKICFQEVKPNYNENSVEENYTGEFHFFEESFKAYETLRCEICSDTIRHTQATLRYIKHCEGDYCDNNASNIDVDIADIITSVGVPEGTSPMFSFTFDIWGEFTDNQLTYEKMMERRDEGHNMAIRLYSITLSTESGDYLQEFSIEPDTTDGLFYWKQSNVICDLDECFE